MKNKSLFIILFLIFSSSISISCVSSKNSETDDLRKELDAMKKEKEDEKLSKQKESENTNQKGGGEKEKEETNKPSPTPTPTPKPKVSGPVGATVAYCNGSNVIVRDSPSLNAKKVNALKKGEKVFVIEESDNYDEWKGTEANWAYIQKEDGARGWVFTPFISYQ